MQFVCVSGFHRREVQLLLALTLSWYRLMSWSFPAGWMRLFWFKVLKNWNLFSSLKSASLTDFAKRVSWVAFWLRCVINTEVMHAAPHAPVVQRRWQVFCACFVPVVRLSAAVLDRPVCGDFTVWYCIGGTYINFYV